VPRFLSAFDDKGFGLEKVNHRAALLRAPVKIERHRDGADLAKGEEKLEILAPAAAGERHEVAGPYAMREEVVAEPVRSEMKIQIGEGLCVVAKSELFGEMLRVSWQPFADIHRWRYAPVELSLANHFFVSLMSERKMRKS
jgi:hypothetical protein